MSVSLVEHSHGIWRPDHSYVPWGSGTQRPVYIFGDLTSVTRKRMRPVDCCIRQGGVVMAMKSSASAVRQLIQNSKMPHRKSVLASNNERTLLPRWLIQQIWKMTTEASMAVLYQDSQKSALREMANLDLEDSPGRNGTSHTEVDDTVWKDLPQELLEKCLGHLPVLMIASTLRAVNRTWRSYPGTSTFMALHNHRKNIDSCFGFLMFGTNILTHQCETMALDHNTRKWQLAPFLQLDGPYRTCQVESVSEGILLLRPHPATSPPFIVWNPLLPSSCQQRIPRMSQDNYWSVNLVVGRENASFKILAFTSWFRECHVFSSTTSSWLSHQEGPRFYEGLFFPQYRDGGHIAVTYQNCLYVAVGSLVDDVHQVGDLCYDVNRNVWKSSAGMFPLPPEIMKLYGYCFTRSLFVVSDVMYKVVEYVGGIHLVGDARPSPTVQILARSVAPENNAEKWRVIATTVLPQSDWESKWFGTWYGCILEGHEKPTICGLFKSEPYLISMMYSIGSCKWKTVCVTDEATSAAALDGTQDPIGIMIRIRHFWRCQWTANQRKWLYMNMVPNYEPSWICPSRECKHGSQEPGC